MTKTKILCWINNYITGKNKFCDSTIQKPIWELRKRKKNYINNIISIPLCECKKTIFEIQGNCNKVEIGQISRLHDSHIAIIGCDNIISIGKNCGIYGLNIVIAGNGCVVHIDDNCNFFCNHEFKGYIATGDGGKIIIGKDCLFAPGILIRADDGHSIFKLENPNKRINHAKDIIIGNHVWCGAKSMILKGVTINEGCIIGAGTILIKGIYEANTVWAGNPAKKIRGGVAWKM